MESESRKDTTPTGGPKPAKRRRAGLAGRKVGPYRIVDEIGKGGMGVVYRGKDTALDRDVAIKVLPAHLGHDDEFMKRFVREARAAAKVDHPSIVQVYQCGRMSTELGDGPLFIAMQFVDGEPLSDLISREGHLEPLRALEITKQVAEALGAAHAAGLIHRDIKSSNILISGDGKAKVTDFGLATSMESDRNKITETGAYLGTPEYSSPEQCEGHELDGRSDIYSLGVVLYEMLVGSVPFEARTPLKLFDKIVHEQPEKVSKVIPGLPREMTGLVDRMLAKDRDQRYASAEELLSALRRVRVALGSWKRGAGTGRRRPVSRRGFRRRSRVELVVAGLAVLLLLVAAAGIWNYASQGNGGNAKTPSGPVTETPGPTPGTPAKNEVGVAIFELENLAGDTDSAWIGHGVPRMLVTKLKSLPGLVVYSRDSTRSALAGAGGSDATAAARKLGARLAVTGTFLVKGREVRVDLHVIDVESGKIAEAVSARAPEAEILTMVDSLGQQLRGRFDTLLARVLGRDGGLARAELRSARELMFLALAAEEKAGRRVQPRKDRDDASGGLLSEAHGAARDKSRADEGNAHEGRKELLKNAPRAAAKPGPEGKKNAAGSLASLGGGRTSDKGLEGAGPVGSDSKTVDPAGPGKREKQVRVAAPPVKSAPPGSGSPKSEQASAKPGQPPSPKKSPVATARRKSESDYGRKAEKKGVWKLQQPLRRGAVDRIRLALRHRLEGEELLESAKSEDQLRSALAKLVLSRSYAPNQRGIDKLIAGAKAKLAARKK